MANYDPPTLDTLKSMVFPGESGGDYNALFGFSNRPGGQFAGTNLTDMTVDQALQFSAPGGAYGQSVKGQIGRVATPMGAWQVVGSTLQAAKNGLGLSGQEKMTPELQDKIGMWIYENQGPQAWSGWGKAGGGAGNAKGAAMPDFQMNTEDVKRPFLERLALAANSLRFQPDQNIASILEARQAKREDRAQGNRTAQWLAASGRPDLAQAVAQGVLDAKSAVAMAYQKPDRVNGIEINGKLVNPQTGEVMADLGQNPKEGFGNEVELMKTYRADPAVQAYTGVSNYYGRMVSAYDETQKNPQAAGAGDLAMVYSYMKMLDPGSTVMQGEYASASNTSGVPDQIRNAYNSVLRGSKLTEQQRLAFLQQAGGMLTSTADALKKTNEVYGGTASRFGVNPGFMVQPITPRAVAYPAGGGENPTVDPGELSPGATQYIPMGG